MKFDCGHEENMGSIWGTIRKIDNIIKLLGGKTRCSTCQKKDYEKFQATIKRIEEGK